MIKRAYRTMGLLWLLSGCSEDGPGPCELGEPQVVCSLAGTGELGFNGDGKPADETDLYWVTKVRRAPDGLVWLMDFNNHRLRVIGADDTISTVSGTGWHGFANTDVPATLSGMENPIDFAFLSTGEVVIASYHDPRVLRLRPPGKLEIVAGTGEPGAGWPYTDGDTGPAIDASFNELGGIAVGQDDQIYVADLDASRVRMIAEHRVQAFAGTGEVGYAGDGGPATAALLNAPSALDVGPDGSVYIADRRNHAVRRVSPDGLISTVAGTGGAGFGGDGGAATAATLDEPNGVAVTDRGVLYIADRNNHRIRRVDLDGTISTVAGTGELGESAGDGASALDTPLGKSGRLSWSPGELFVADQSNSYALVIYLDD